MCLCLLCSVASLTFSFSPHPVGPVFIRCVLRRDEEGNGGGLRSWKTLLCTGNHFVFFPQWLETRPERQECPVCKAGISREKVVPLYGRGSQKPQDPRLKTPPRPQGQRPAPESRGGFQPFGDTGGFHFSFGVGAFPFGFFTTVFNTHEPFRRGTGVDLGQGHPASSWQDSLFLFLAIFFFFWLLSI